MSFTIRVALLGSILLTLVVILAACGPAPSAQDKVQAQMAKVHPLADSERALAEANAKAFFNRPWTHAGGKSGAYIACRPSDSNFNGLVTCTGFIPQPDGTMPEMTRYCGYRPDLVGCSDQDTVKP